MSHTSPVTFFCKVKTNLSFIIKNQTESSQDNYWKQENCCLFKSSLQERDRQRTSFEPPSRTSVPSLIWGEDLSRLMSPLATHKHLLQKAASSIC